MSDVSREEHDLIEVITCPHCHGTGRLDVAPHLSHNWRMVTSAHGEGWSLVTWVCQDCDAQVCSDCVADGFETCADRPEVTVGKRKVASRV